MIRLTHAEMAHVTVAASLCVVSVLIAGCINGVPPVSEASVGYVRCPAGKIEDAEDGDTQVINHEGRGGYWFTSVDTAGSVLEQAKFGMSEGGQTAATIQHAWLASWQLQAKASTPC